MGIKIGNVEFYCGPKEVGAEDNLEEVIVNYIDSATKKLDIAIQELESRPIAKAIIRARQRKVRIKIVVEHD